MKLIIKIQKLAEHLGHKTFFINDIVYVKTKIKGYIEFKPLGTHALEIEEAFDLDTKRVDVAWISTGKHIIHSANIAAEARLYAALSYLEE